MPDRAVTFDYEILSPDARTIAREAATAWRELNAAELRYANAWLERGRFLSRVWAALGHGHRLGWLKAETSLATKTAERLMAAYDLLGPHIDFDNLANLPKLERSAVYELSGDVPEQIKQTFIPRILAGERGLRKQILAAIRPAAADDPPSAGPEPDPRPGIKPGRDRPDEFDEVVARHLAALTEADRRHLHQIAEALPPGLTLDALVEADRWQRAAPKQPVEPETAGSSDAAEPEADPEEDPGLGTSDPNDDTGRIDESNGPGGHQRTPEYIAA